MRVSNEKGSFIKVISLSKFFRMVTNLTSFGFVMKELCILEVEENHLFNGNGPKCPIMFMNFLIEFEIPPNIKVELDILNLIMEYEWISYHTN